MDWDGDAKQTVSSHSISHRVCTLCPEMWEMVVVVFTGFQVTTQGLFMQKEFSGEWSSNHSEEMALEIW